MYPELNKVTINEDNLMLRLQCMPTHPMGCSYASMSLSQPLCTYCNKGSHMLSIVDTWGCMQHLFKSCFAIVTTGFCSVSPMRMHWHLVSQEIKQSYARTMMQWYTTSNRQGIFSQWGFFPYCLMMACLIATDDVYEHHKCQQSIFPLRKRFYASLIIILQYWDT